MMAQLNFWDDCLVVKQLVGSWANFDNSLGSFYGEFPGHFLLPNKWNEIPIYTWFTEIPAIFSMPECCLPGLLGAKALVRTVALLKVVATDAGKRATSLEKVAVGKAPGRFIPGHMGRQVCNLAWRRMWNRKVQVGLDWWPTSCTMRSWWCIEPLQIMPRNYITLVVWVIYLRGLIWTWAWCIFLLHE